MSSVEAEGPGQGTAPGLPLALLHYRLTPADALAWEMLPTEARGWVKLALFAPWIMLGLGWGAIDGHDLPFWQHAALASAPALAVWALSQALMARGRQRRALARIPAPLDMVCEVWGDHLSAHAVGHPQAALILAPETIRQVVLTPDRLFLDAASSLLILPRAAFAGAEDMAAFAAHWDSLSQQAQP